MKQLIILSSVLVVLFTAPGCGDAAENKEQEVTNTDTGGVKEEGNRDSLLDAVNKSLQQDTLKK